MDIRHAVGVKEGIDAATLAALPRWQASHRFTAPERAALALCEALVRDDLEVTDECFAGVREHFSEADTVELVFVINYRSSRASSPRPSSSHPRDFPQAPPSGRCVVEASPGLAGAGRTLGGDGGPFRGPPYGQFSMKALRFRPRSGWRSLRRALASI
jgi:hypothetical protein